MYPSADERYDSPELGNDRYPEVSKRAVFDKINQRLQAGMSVGQSIDAMVADSKISAEEILKIYNEYKDR